MQGVGYGLQGQGAGVAQECGCGGGIGCRMGDDLPNGGGVELFDLHQQGGEPAMQFFKGAGRAQRGPQVQDVIAQH